MGFLPCVENDLFYFVPTIAAMAVGHQTPTGAVKQCQPPHVLQLTLDDLHAFFPWM